MYMLIGIAVLPVIILLVYIYVKDKNEREPLGLLLKAFACGGLVAVVILVIAFITRLIGLNPWAFAEQSAVMQSFFQAAIPEEGLKFLFLYWLIWNNKEFNEHFDGIVYAVFVSMGFACVENILYVFQGGVEVGIARALLSVPGHFLFAVIMGYYFSRARFRLTHRAGMLILAVILPVLAHGIYDTLCFVTDMYGEETGPTSVFFSIFILFDVVLWKIGQKKINRFCHFCGRKIPKGAVYCPFCELYLENPNENNNINHNK